MNATPSTRSTVRQLRADVESICFPRGRVVGSPGHRKARKVLCARLEEVGCVPFSGDSFELPYQRGGTSFCNLIGVIPGSNPRLAPLLVGAHYDSAILAPCADDNAAAVAIALAAAEYAVSENELERDLIIAIFDAEECPFSHSGSMGSQRFYHDQRGGRAIHAAIIMDLVGHDVSIHSSMLGLVPQVGGLLKKLPGLADRDIPLPVLAPLPFITGTESHPDLPDVLEDAGVADGLKLGDVSGSENATISWNNSLTIVNPLIVRSGSTGSKSLSANTSVTSSIASLEINDNLTKSGSGTLTVTGGTTLKGGNRIVTADAGTLTLGGNLSSVGGTYGLTKSGAGILRLNGDNSGYSGTVTFAQASLHVGHANALGTGAFISSNKTNTLTNVSGAAITLSNTGYTVSSSLIIGGSTSAADILTGPGTFSLSGGERILSVNGGVKLTIGGDFSGNLRKDGNGTMILAAIETWRQLHFGTTSWTANGAGTVITEDGNLQIVSITIPAASSDRHFARLRVTAP